MIAKGRHSTGPGGGRPRRHLALLLSGLGCCALAACAPPPPPPPPFAAAPYHPMPQAQAERMGRFGGPGDTLETARAACNEAYPAKVGNYLGHAHCVNAAVEKFALPKTTYPDLVRLQEQVRANISEAIDQGRLDARAGERRMAEADRLIGEAESSRNAADRDEAERRVAEVQAILR